MCERDIDYDFEQLQKEIHKLARKKGWWPGYKSVEDIGKTNIPEKLALIHSEISEALEEYRRPESWPQQVWYGEGNKPEGFGVELADAVIRIMDLCEALGIPLASIIRNKHAYNSSRPKRHGGKKA